MLSSTIISCLLTALAVSATPTPRNNGGGKDTTLDGLAQKTNRYIGTATNSFNIQGTNPGGAYVSVLESDFRGALTAENEGKWEVIHPALNTYNFTGMDIIVAESKKIGGIVRGHNFVWYQQTPAYVTSITDPAQLKSVFQAHVDNVAGRYQNDWAYLDVINEPLNDNGTLRDSVWYDVLGEDYLEYTLRYVHQVAPNIKLCINDYNIESVGPKSKALAALAKKLLAKGVPLHCIGFESHFVGGQIANNSDIAASMKQFTDMGLEVPLTELDVRIMVDTNDQPLAQSELQTQANDYGNSVKTCFANPLCPGVTIWQFYDPVSWIPGVFPGEGAADLYDASYNKKPAYYAVRDTIKAAPANAKFKGSKN